MTDNSPFILVVDDNPQNLQVIGNLLAQEEYETAFALSGKEALEFVATEKPDLILLDIMMPEMDGIEVCQRLKKDKRLKDIPIIFLTAKAEKDDIVKGFDVGAVDYVTKPFNSAELLARIRTHVALKRAREEIKTLKGIIPICANCKKIRDDKGYWEQLEVFIQEHSDAQFSHGLCPSCINKLYPEIAEKMAQKNIKLE